MGNIIFTNSNQTCDFCPEGPQNHTTSQHVCNLCNKVGDHTSSDHKNCKYCLNDHKTEEHVCITCGQLGHDKIDHQCIFCTGLHQSNDHICNLCNKKGHQLNNNKHPYCGYCKNYSNHETDGHLAILSRSQLIAERDNWKYCCYCKKHIYTENNMCRICQQYVDPTITCPRTNCGYISNNSLTIYCPICGELITCRSCSKQIYHTPMYEDDSGDDNDDNHSYCGHSISGDRPDKHKQCSSYYH